MIDFYGERRLSPKKRKEERAFTFSYAVAGKACVTGVCVCVCAKGGEKAREGEGPRKERLFTRQLCFTNPSHYLACVKKTQKGEGKSRGEDSSYLLPLRSSEAVGIVAKIITDK
jgi:hypothetical protein